MVVGDDDDECFCGLIVDELIPSDSGMGVVVIVVLLFLLLGFAATPAAEVVVPLLATIFSFSSCWMIPMATSKSTISAN